VNKAEAVYLSGLLADCRDQGIESTWIAPLQGAVDRRLEAVRRTQAAPKPKGALKPEPAALRRSRPIVAARSGGHCEARTDWCEGQATQVHHIARRNGATAHDPENLLHLCGAGNVTGCHGAAHQHPDWAYRHGLLRREGQVPFLHVGCPLSCTEDHEPTAVTS
jgi:hypothetical protein